MRADPDLPPPPIATTIRKASRGAARPPAAAVLLSPAVDLRAIGDSYVANDGRDPLATRDAMSKLVAAYLGAASETDPEASPILADYGDGFVPTMITTGTRDLLQSDCVRFYWTLRDAGVSVRLRVWENVAHAADQHEVAVLRRTNPRPRLNCGRPGRLRRAHPAVAADAARGTRLVTPGTIMRWHCCLVRKKWTYPNRPGRPPISETLATPVARMARKNPSWGYRRSRASWSICHHIGASTIRRIVRHRWIPSAPSRQTDTSW